MFLTKWLARYRGKLYLIVAIPSNRVNVSHLGVEKIENENVGKAVSRNPLESGQCFSLVENLHAYKGLRASEKSQSPRIGSMFLTRKFLWMLNKWALRRNPLESGQCFSQAQDFAAELMASGHCRNPLESGQCFSLGHGF